MEAWGRKKRSVASGKQDSIGKQLGDDMTLSREIVVLDLKEKDPGGDFAQADSGGSQSTSSSNDGAVLPGHKQSPLRSPASDAQSADYTSSTNSQSTSNFIGLDMSSKHCVSSQYLFVLICSIGLFFVLYVCVVAFFFARRDPKISPIKHQYH